MTEAETEAARIAAQLVEVGGGVVRGVLLFGSQLVGASPDRHSAFDLVVLVDGYRDFYEALADRGHHRRHPGLLAVLAKVLPPNVIAFFPEGPEGAVAKAMVLTLDDFRLGMGPRAHDHFLKGRLVQRVSLVWDRDPATAEQVSQAVEDARHEVLEWLAPFIEEPFDAESFTRQMLEVSYRGEVRPEAAERVRQVFEAQRRELIEAFTPVLERAEAAGKLVREGEGWRRAARPRFLAKLSRRLYFLRSKTRATCRWFKYTLTFDDWLNYIVRKVERRTGMTVEITPLERKYPLLFLWPKVIAVLRARPDRLASADEPQS